MSKDKFSLTLKTLLWLPLSTGMQGVLQWHGCIGRGWWCYIGLSCKPINSIDSVPVRLFDCGLDFLCYKDIQQFLKCVYCIAIRCTRRTSDINLTWIENLILETWLTLKYRHPADVNLFVRCLWETFCESNYKRIKGFGLIENIITVFMHIFQCWGISQLVSSLELKLYL